IPGGDFFSWHQVHNQEQRTNFVTYNLVDGINTIDFGHREDGVGLDKVYVTKTGSVPNGTGNAASNCNNNAAKSAVTDPLIITLNKDIYKLELYPNPTSELANVVLDQNIPRLEQILIFDASGRLVRTQKLNGRAGTGIQQHEVKVDGLEEGTYHLQFLTEDGNSFYKQLVVKK
ncbi:T9SS type A sorting domain-containing protein, partial [Zeaxanthinibacter enoshimensis]|uniref:T9SS type A sorting domain-containing protein n=1 Tax=Zeaxanthinibacter enoshimensis TaxID=392009 RepID=UPI001414CEE5